MSDEVRITNPRTGAQKGSKLARYDLVPPRSLKAVAEHFGKGAKKYDARNWEKGVDWSLSYAALMRHITQWWSGEDFDEDDNPHLSAVAWHAMALIEYAVTHPELDDRPKASFANVMVVGFLASEAALRRELKEDLDRDGW